MGLSAQRKQECAEKGQITCRSSEIRWRSRGPQQVAAEAKKNERAISISQSQRCLLGPTMLDGLPWRLAFAWPNWVRFDINIKLAEPIGSVKCDGHLYRERRQHSIRIHSTKFRPKFNREIKRIHSTKFKTNFNREIKIIL